MGFVNILKIGIKAIASTVMDEVLSTIGLAAEMDNYPDERLMKIIKTGALKQKSAAAYALKKRGN
ncbi:hypothetical protein [Clostridium sp.]|uniref:hypothetical protein n=1 Tax=Clostridium sp. TaxID=1506 RepID=UPI001A54416D|nr:hypothetical protein [Clostridium sp.]MBK5241687.1 hypothetical protein [Clostridium sp.]